MSRATVSRVLCVSGDSGSGKTALLRRLLPRLDVPRDRIGVVKDTHHAIDWHPPGKDSGDLWAAGPASLCVVGPDQTALFLRGEATDDPTRRLARACRRLPPETRLVLAEGFRDARAPKVWTAAGPPDPGASAPGVRAVVVPAEHVPAWGEARPDVPVYRREEIAELPDRVPGWAVPVSELTTP